MEWNVNYLIPGLRLASNVYFPNAKSELLFEEGCILTKEMISKLKRRKIAIVSVEIDETINHYDDELFCQTCELFRTCDISNILKIIRKYVDIATNSDNLIFGKKIVLDHNGKHQEIDYSDVSEIRLSMCSRIYNQGVIEYNPAKWFVKIWQTGAVGTVMVHIQYYLDFNIVLKDNILKFENTCIYDSLPIIRFLKDKGVVVNDPYQIENILTKYPDAMKLVNFLNEAFPKMAKKYGLDNPRGVEAIK